jgi:hypothetical protein
LPISAADLLSRVPGRARHSRAMGFRPSGRHLRPVPPTGWDPSLWHRIAPDGAGWPLLAVPAPGRQRVGARCQLLSECHPAGSFGVPHETRVGVVGPSRAGQSDSQAPRVAIRGLTRHPGIDREGQNLLLALPHQGTGSAAPRRLPPPGPTATCRAHARSMAAWAATGAPVLPLGAQRPTCVHAPTQGALDPKAGRLFAGACGPPAA